jgi:hypothetical protein
MCSSTILEGGEWLTSRPGLFTPRKRASVPTGEEGGWAPEPVWTMWKRKNLDLTRRYTHWAIPAPVITYTIL